jgi:PAS domain S-box-containing protein
MSDSTDQTNQVNDRASLSRSSRIIIWICISLTFLVSLFNLAGWIFHIPWLINNISGWVSMKAPTAFCFLITSLALTTFLFHKLARFRSASLLGAGIFLMMVSLLGLSTYVLPEIAGNPNITPALQSMFNQPFFNRGWMSLLTASIFLVFGVIMVLLSRQTRLASNIAHILLVPAALASYTVFISYLMSAYFIHDFITSPVSFKSGFLFCLITGAIFLIRPDTWLTKGFTNPGIGGIMSRRLLPGLIAIPIILGWIYFELERQGPINPEIILLLITITNTCVFLILLWNAAKTANQIDRHQHDLDEALKKSYSELEDKIQDRTKDLIKLNEQLEAEIKVRIAAEKMVEDERNRMDMLLEMMPVYLILLTPDYQVVYSNKFFRDRFGESHGRRCFESLFNRTEPCEICETYKVLNNLEPVTWEWNGPDGCTYSIFDFPFTNYDGSQLIMEMGIDVTSLKNAEAELVTLNAGLEQKVAERTSELLKANEQLRTAQRLAHLGSIEIDHINDNITGSEEICTIFGANPEDFNSTFTTFFERIHPDDLASVRDAYYSSVRGGADNFESEHRILQKDTGDIRYVFEKFSHLRDTHGKMIKSVGMIHDVTERKQMEINMQRNNERLDILSQTSSRLLASENPQEIVNSLCKRVMNFLDCQVFFNFLTVEGSEKLRLNSYDGIPENTAKKIEWLDFGGSVCGCVAREGKRIIAFNIPETADPRTNLVKSFGIRAYACHPLLSNDKVIGTLSFGTSKRNSFNDDELSLMKIVADQVAIALGRAKDEQALRKSEERYRLLMELSPEAIFLIRQNRVTLLNSTARQLLGGTSENEIIGQSVFDIFHPDSHDRISQRIREILAGEFCPMTEEKIVKADGTVRVTEVVAAEITDSEGQAIQLIISDITERIEAELALKESKKKLDQALESGKIGVWEWDIPTGVVKWDSRMETMFGMEPGTFDETFSSFENCIHELDLPHVRNAFQQALNENIPLHTVYRIKHKDNTINHITTKALVEKDPDGNPVKMSGVCFDITEMKRGAEKVLFSLNEDLRRSNRELEQFAYLASHDLQEPLRMVTSFTQLLAMRYKDKLDQDAQEFIHFAVDGATRMQVLINDLLDYSRIERQGRQFMQVDMHDALAQALLNLKFQINEKDARITNSDLPEVVADPGQMIRLFQNLIGNGLKFSKKSPQIHISAVEMNEHYQFSVNDNGIGIEPQYFARIFQIFQRLHPKEEYQGTGIGLAICQRIIERHGGKIWVESNPGLGSTFYFTLPKPDKILKDAKFTN